MAASPKTLSRCSSPTPSSSYSGEDMTSASGSRKRARSDLSTEERKEARAHRNRLAAQHSRDKRKAQLSYLEERVAQLEEENAALRRSAPPAKKKKEDEKEALRERENEELRERIKSLEQGWDAVVKALKAQGLPAGILPSIGGAAVDMSTTPIVDDSEQQQQSPALSANSPPASPSVNTFPLLDSTSPFTFNFANDDSLLSSSLLSQTPETTTLSTRHLAAGGQGASSTDPEQQNENENEAMETLFREILADHPTISTPTGPAFTSAAPPMTSALSMSEAWTASGLEEDVQRLFGLIPDSNLGSDLDGFSMDINTGLDAVDWMDDLNMTFPVHPSSSIGVF